MGLFVANIATEYFAKGHAKLWGRSRKTWKMGKKIFS